MRAKAPIFSSVRNDAVLLGTAPLFAVVVLFALDLIKPGGPLKWTFEPNPSSQAKGEACCDWVNRGPTIPVAVDANAGKPLWRTHLGNISKGETMTMAPHGGARQGLRP